jgi:hypothetical protein
MTGAGVRRHPVGCSQEACVGYREDKVAGADEASLRRLVALVDDAPDELWSWLVGPEAESESFVSVSSDRASG